MEAPGEALQANEGLSALTQESGFADYRLGVTGDMSLIGKNRSNRKRLLEAWGEIMLMHSTMAAVTQCCVAAPPGLSSKSPASVKIALAMATAPF